MLYLAVVGALSVLLLSDYVFEDALKGDTPIVTASKGLEIETFRTPSRILAEVLGDRTIGVLSGPSHAEEVARGKPASVVAASASAVLARDVQRLLSGATLRVYTHADPLGAELGGALKNVVAIAAGISWAPAIRAAACSGVTFRISYGLIQTWSPG